jgi:hypothetical protein
MIADRDLLKKLATRAREGNRAARTEFREQVEGSLVLLVREALQGRGRPEFQRQVCRTATRLTRYAGDEPWDHERLVRRVASCLVDALADHLACSLTLSQRMRETVCA